MLCPLLAYDVDGNVVAVLDHVVARDPSGKVAGLVDFASHEDAGGEHTDIWSVSNAVGSKVWPEWLGSQAHEFHVELDGPPGRKRISALVHNDSGFRRERATLEANIAMRIAIYAPDPADIRDLVGGPDSPLLLDFYGAVEIVAPLPASDLPILTISDLIV